MQIKDWDKPFPKGTKTVVLVDVFGGGKPVFYVIPAKAYAKIIEKHGKGLDPVRPNNPDRNHCYIGPELVADYEGRWDLAEGWADAVCAAREG